MEEVRRVTTTKKSSQLVNTLLVVAGALGLALILVAVYFYMIKPNTQKPQVASKECVCYYVDPAVTTECGDPRKGFLFKQVTTQGDTSCQSQCQTSSLPITDIASKTKQELFLSCSLSSIQDTRCTEMTISNKDGKIVVGNIPKDEELTVEAKFDKKYENPTFRINNTDEKPDSISDDGLSIKKKISSLKTTTVDIVATAEGEDGESINSPLCKRIIEVEQKGQSSVTGLLLSKRKTETTTKISQAILRISNISDPTDIKIIFSFDDEELSPITMIKGFSLDTLKGEFSIIEQDLYNPINFSDENYFANLDGYVGELIVTAEVIKSNVSLGSAEATITFEEPVEPVEPVVPTISNFSITTTSNLTCVERVEPTNAVIFTINIKNNSTISQKVLGITDKLPLGFTYVIDSTKINNISMSDRNYLVATQVGQTTELKWRVESGWSIGSNQSLVLVFQAIAGPDALTGDNQNEVVIEPAQVPTDPASLRASSTVNVSQNCNPTDGTGQTPETGIFDEIAIQIGAGILVLVVGWYIYSKPFGQVVAKKFVNSGIFQGAEMTSWKLFKPKRYFEEITIKRIRKKKN